MSSGVWLSEDVGTSGSDFAVPDLYGRPLLQLETACLNLMTREVRLVSQDAPGMVVLKNEANAGIEETIIAM